MSSFKETQVIKTGTKESTGLFKKAVLILLSLALAAFCFGCSSGGSSSEDTEWGQFLADYETWADDFDAFMDKAIADPEDSSLMDEYEELTNDAREWTSRASEIAEKVPAEEAENFVAEINRITSKINDSIMKLRDVQ